MFVLVWIYYSNYMLMYRPMIGLKTDRTKPLSLAQSLKLLYRLRRNVTV